MISITLAGWLVFGFGAFAWGCGIILGMLLVAGSATDRAAERSKDLDQ